MGQRVRVLIVFLVLAGVGVLVGSVLLGRGSGGEAPNPEPPPASLSSRVRVEVLNGSGAPGVAWQATEVLRDRGFDVVYYGNAGTYSGDSSVVMDRVGFPEQARAVARALGISRVESVPDSSLFLDVTVRVGPDWGGPEAPPGEEPESPPWWDLRRFFQQKGQQPEFQDLQGSPER